MSDNLAPYATGSEVFVISANWDSGCQTNLPELRRAHIVLLEHLLGDSLVYVVSQKNGIPELLIYQENDFQKLFFTSQEEAEKAFSALPKVGDKLFLKCHDSSKKWIGYVTVRGYHLFCKRYRYEFCFFTDGYNVPLDKLGTQYFRTLIEAKESSSFAEAYLSKEVAEYLP